MRFPILLGAALLPLACGGKVLVEPGGTGGASTSSSTGPSSTTSTSTGLPPPPAGTCNGIPNDCCATAIDATAGGTFSGTTCGADATFTWTGMCGPIGSPDAFYFVDYPAGVLGSYQVDVTAGFYVMVTNMGADCTVPSGCILPGDMGVTYSDGPRWIAIQRSDGACGPFTVTFTKLH